MLNLDTHIFLRALVGTLTRREADLVESEDCGISAIVLWEIAKLHQLGRINTGLEHPLLAEQITQMRVWPIDQRVVYAVLQLDFTSDPADELIAATSLAYGAPLVTRDSRVRESKVVPFAI